MTVRTDDERYKIIDNSVLEDVIVSRTILHAHQETKGNIHEWPEIYIFLDDGAEIVLGEGKPFKVERKLLIYVGGNEFHKVWNTTNKDVEFICIWHKQKNW